MLPRYGIADRIAYNSIGPIYLSALIRTTIANVQQIYINSLRTYK